MQGQRGVSLMGIVIILAVVVIISIGYLVAVGGPKRDKLPEFKSAREEFFTKHANKINRVAGVELKLPTAVSASAANAGRDPRIPNTVPNEFIYKGAALVSLEQMARRGVALVLITPDSEDSVAKAVLKQVKDAGWEVYEGGDTIFSVKRGSQKANVRVEKDDQTVLVIALTFKK